MVLTPRIYTKQPGEKETIKIDFSNRLPSGVTISSLTSAKMYKYSDDTDVSSTMITNTSVTSPYVYVQIDDGTDGVEYYLTVKIVLDNGDNIEEDLRVLVDENK